MPAQFVKPYLKSNKSDTLDAEAIAEAVTRPSMRFVQAKAIEQIDVQSLHRVRDQMVMQRTRLITQMRGFCLEYGGEDRSGSPASPTDSVLSAVWRSIDRFVDLSGKPASASRST